MIELIILAVALSMDAFAVSIGLGTKMQNKTLPIKAGLFFGLFQAMMPIVGYFGGKGALSVIESYTNWIAFALLCIIGGKMIYEAKKEGIEEDISSITNKLLLVLAIATSVDAMAAGFTLILMNVNLFMACTVIGVTTFCFSVAGVYIGKRSGAWLESKAEYLGGFILICMGIKFLIF